MNSIGIFNLIAGLLQLTVPSYALRLVRRFGAPRVGWFLVAAFASLAALHLASPARSLTGGTRFDLVFAFASGLLLIGMGHLETLLTDRQAARREALELERKIQTEVKGRTAELEENNAELLKEIARRDQREKVLKESEAQYRLLFAENPLPMLVFDLRTSGVLAVNWAAVRQYGHTAEEFQGLSARELVPAEVLAGFLQDLSRPCSGVESRGLWRHARKDLSQMEVEITAMDLKYNGSPARLIVAPDVSSRRRSEADAKQKQELELIGRLAGGFAHHFNNILTIIDCQATLLLSNANDSKTAAELRQICTAAHRAAGLTKQLLAAGGKQLTQLEPLDLNALLLKSSQMLHRLTGQRISVQSALGTDLPPVLADARMVEHILVNLVLNARDAMRAGGTLTLQTDTVFLSEREALQRTGARPGKFTRLIVRDTGSGIAPEIQPHIFEPFFTTHDIGAATGMGLASVWGAVQQQAGWIDFTSHVGSGTEFRVHFPCAAASATPVRTETASTRPLTKGTVLLVEADDRLRGLARYALNRQGYHVIEADTANTVLRLCEADGMKADLMVLDANLPGDSSQTLADKLQQAMPRLKIVCTTPAPGPDETPKPIAIQNAQTLPKPYSANQLIDAVQAAWPKAVS